MTTWPVRNRPGGIPEGQVHDSAESDIRLGIRRPYEVRSSAAPFQPVTSKRASKREETAPGETESESPKISPSPRRGGGGVKADAGPRLN